MLKNCARDWSAEGAAERAQSYGRICAELQRLFAGWPAGAATPPAVLVPGAGLARLCLEIVNLVGGWASWDLLSIAIRGWKGGGVGSRTDAKAAACCRAAVVERPASQPTTPACPAARPAKQGFQAQGNEFSYFMLLASAYLLNGVERPEQVGGAGRGGAGRGAGPCPIPCLELGSEGPWAAGQQLASRRCGASLCLFWESREEVVSL